MIIENQSPFYPRFYPFRPSKMTFTTHFLHYVEGGALIFDADFIPRQGWEEIKKPRYRSSEAMGRLHWEVHYCTNIVFQYLYCSFSA